MEDKTGGFCARLREAATAKGMPKRHQGAAKWLRFGLEARFGTDLSEETTRRWLAGTTMPTRDNVGKLAELLDVSTDWLIHGTEPGPAASKHKATVPGYVNALAGFICMDGGHVSFPEEGDHFAAAQGVDLYSIIDGVMHNIHVAEGQRVDARQIRFELPPRRDSSLVVLGVLRLRDLCIEVFKIPDEVRPDAGGPVVAPIDSFPTVHRFISPLI